MRYRGQYNKKILQVILMSAFILSGIFASSSLYAEDGAAYYNSEEVNVEMASENSYHNMGTLDLIGNDYIVMDDSIVKLGPGVEVSDAVLGKYIGIQLNDNGQAVRIEIINEPK